MPNPPNPPLHYDEYMSFNLDVAHVGENYRKGGNALILHYSHTNTTADCVASVMQGGPSGPWPLGRDDTFMQIVEWKPDFPWDTVCVFNCLTRYLGHGHYGHIDEACYDESAPRLAADLETQRPKRFLIMGHRFRKTVDIVHRTLSRHYGSEILALDVPHPNARKSKSLIFKRYDDAWERLIKEELLAESLRQKAAWRKSLENLPEEEKARIAEQLRQCKEEFRALRKRLWGRE